MITDADIKRINELYHKSKSEGLTPDEKQEQVKLREAYIESVRANMRSQLNNIDVKRPDGSIVICFTVILSCWNSFSEFSPIICCGSYITDI